MPNKRFYKKLDEALRINKEIKGERKLILALAHTEADRKYYEVHYDIRKLEEKKMYTSIKDYEAREKIDKDIAYLKTCLDGWQETLNHIREWDKEISGS